MPYIYNFEWDPEKANRNLKKHGVSFKNLQLYSKTQMLFPCLILITVKMKTDGSPWVFQEMLVVIHTFLEKRDGTIIIRIISSRKATKQESLTYGE